MSLNDEQAGGSDRPTVQGRFDAPSFWTRLRRWRFTAVGLVATCLLAIAAMNLVVDPYCAYRAGPPFLLDYKPSYELPKTKAALVASLRPTALIMGASRSLVFNPRWKGWGPYGALNIGMHSASMDLHARALQYAVSVAKVERVLLCVDLSQFNHDAPPEAFGESQFSPAFSSLGYHLHNLLSPEACGDSLRTVGSYLSGAPAEYTLLGDVRGGKFPHEGSSRDRFLQTIKKIQKKYSHYQRSSEATDGLRQIVKLSRAKNIELTVVVMPVHALYLETLASQNLLGEYETWLQDVTTIVAEESGGQLGVWDFAGYNAYTTESVPAYDRSPAPKYYQEPSHFTAALADKVLARAYDAPDADPSFGVLLVPENVAERIADLHAERERWLAQRPDAINLLATVFPDRRLETPREARR